LEALEHRTPRRLRKAGRTVKVKISVERKKERL
jgi:hypothetical protein